jgi:phosphoserine phosphatase RsbU/P
MGSGSQRRRWSLPVAVKLVVPISFLVAASVAAAGWVSLGTIHRLAEREAASRRRDGKAAIERQSEIMAGNAGNAAALLLAEGNYSYLDPLVQRTVSEDSRLTWMLIADAASDRIVARTAGAPAGAVLADAIRDQVAGSDRAVFLHDPSDPTRFVLGVRLMVGDRLVGQLRLGVSTAALEAELARTIADARAQAAASARGLLLVAGVILLVAILVGALGGWRLVRPIRALSAQAHRIAEGDLGQRVEVGAHDEIGQLADDFNFMAERLQQLIADTASKAALEQEMILARSVQESMIPNRHMIEHGDLRIVGYCEPATACGGDWWTLRKMSGDRALLAIGDVTGHGIPSAMVAATARGAVEALAKVDERLLTPEQVLSAIDSAIRGVGTQQLLMTCFAALIDPRRGVIQFSNAAHNFPYLLHVDERHRVRDLAVLALRGSPLGNAPGELTLRSGERKLDPGDVFVFYTDGVIDRVDAIGNRFGDRRLRGLLQRRLLAPEGAGLTALRDDILLRMSQFACGAPADDDVTLVLCEYDPRPVAAERPRASRGQALA